MFKGHYFSNKVHLCKPEIPSYYCIPIVATLSSLMSYHVMPLKSKDSLYFGEVERLVNANAFENCGRGSFNSWWEYTCQKGQRIGTGQKA